VYEVSIGLWWASIVFYRSWIGVPWRGSGYLDDVRLNITVCLYLQLLKPKHDSTILNM
jgi:hypothetical protein